MADLSKVEALLIAIDELVRDDAPYREKVESIKAAAAGNDMANLEEFLAWFDEVDDEGKIV